MTETATTRRCAISGSHAPGTTVTLTCIKKQGDKTVFETKESSEYFTVGHNFIGTLTDTDRGHSGRDDEDPEHHGG